MQRSIEGKIRFDLRFIQSVFLQTNALSVIRPIPGLHAETPLLVINHFLDIGLLPLRARSRCRDNTSHKFQCRVRRFRHLIGGTPASVALEPKQLRTTGA
ncbi:hypothetical protein D3C86_1622530 [compost metagenome]